MPSPNAVSTALIALLQSLSAQGVLVLPNPTVAFCPPPAGAIAIFNQGQENPERTFTSASTSATHTFRIELFLSPDNILGKTMNDLEGQLASALRADRSLGGTIDQMFLFPTGTDLVSGEGEQIDVSTFSLQLTYETTS